MRTLVSSLLAIAIICAASGGVYPRRDEPGGSLKVGNDLPGTFHPYNVTGPHKQRYHCLISEHGLDPMVMIFYQNVDFSDPLPKLLTGLDAAIEKNKNAPLGAFAVFLPNDLPDAAGSKENDQKTNNKNDDSRIELEKKIENNATDLKIKHVVLCLDHKSDVAKYKLGDDKLITVVLYKRLKIVAVHALTKSEFTDAAVGKIMADVNEKFGAKKK